MHIEEAYMARTTLDLDEELIEKARELAGVETKTAAIEEALREFINERRRQALINRFGTGKIDMTPEELTELRHLGTDSSD
jgi:Arc/MetJ family transcription regulator